MNNSIKNIAFYFPQFHATPENSNWWGKGFTDWDLVKKASKITPQHNQPRIPLDDYFYDLSQASSISWQVNLAEKYNLGGFNFYHYWFDGKLILEKPMELFLENKEHNLDFCITWANETWTKQWVGSKEVLIEQKHINDKNIWRSHFYYLVKFFKDPRYIKINNKPVFCVYRPELNKSMLEYIYFFNEEAKNNGFEGIYFIGMKSYDLVNENEFFKGFDAKLKFQPRYLFNNKFLQRNSGISFLEKFARVLPEYLQLIIGRVKFYFENYKTIDYEEFCEELILQAMLEKDETVMQTIIVDWDNTPRYGKKSKFFTGVTPLLFKKYLIKLNEVEANKGNPFVFINAWNEWSEGAYLEPDKKNKFAVLEAIKEAHEEINKNSVSLGIQR